MLTCVSPLRSWLSMCNQQSALHNTFRFLKLNTPDSELYENDSRISWKLLTLQCRKILVLFLWSIEFSITWNTVTISYVDSCKWLQQTLSPICFASWGTSSSDFPSRGQHPHIFRGPPLGSKVPENVRCPGAVFHMWLP